MEKQPILFDGVCGLCNRAVDFVLREDRNQKFLFAPLQGETFKAFVKDHPEASAVDSAFVLCYTAQGEQLLMRSDAMFYILGQLPQFGSDSADWSLHSSPYSRCRLPIDRLDTVSGLGEAGFLPATNSGGRAAVSPISRRLISTSLFRTIDLSLHWKPKTNTPPKTENPSLAGLSPAIPNNANQKLDQTTHETDF